MNLYNVPLKVLIIIVPAFIFSCDDHRSPDTPTLTAEEYFTKMKQLLSYATNTQPGQMQQSTTAKEILQNGLSFYQQTLDSVNRLNPPSTVLQQHTNYKNALSSNRAAFQSALDQTPDNAPGADYYKYLYHSPDAGYAFGQETDAQCDLATAAALVGITDFPSRQACHEKPQPGQSIGNVAAPVNDITIVHDSACAGRCPNLQYSITSITAKASAPITITFDNRNPLPFLFNLAVYKGNAERLTVDQLVDATEAGGPKIHKLTLTLKAGTYTYVDNVHPYSIRGTLTVVP